MGYAEEKAREKEGGEKMKLEDVGVVLILTLLAALVVAGARWADRREERRHQIDYDKTWRDGQ